MKNTGLFKGSVVYLISNSIAAAIPILLLPVITRRLLPEEYGIWTSYLLLSNLLLPLVGLGSDSSINTYYFKMDRKHFAVYLSNVLLIVSVTSLILFLLVLMSGRMVESLLEIPGSWSILSVVYLLSFQICEIFLGILRLNEKSVEYGIFKISRTTLEISFILILLFHTAYTWEGLIISQLAAFFTFSCISLIFLWRKKIVTFRLDIELIRKAIGFGMPVIPHTIGSILIGITDRWFILKYYGLAEMGLYSVGLQIGMIMSLLQNSFNQAWIPWLFSRLARIDMGQKLTLVKFSYAYMVALLLVALGMSLVMPWFLKIFVSDEFEGAAIFIFWILLGFAFNGMYKVVVNYLFYLERTGLIGIVTLTTAILNIAFNFVLIEVSGPVGASQATCLAFLVQFLIIWYCVAKVYPMPWSLRKSIKI